MKRILIITAMVFSTSLFAQSRQIVNIEDATVVRTEFVAEKKQCVKKGTDVTGAVTGGAIGAGVGAVAGRMISRKSGGFLGGLIGAGVGAMVGGSDEECNVIIPRHYVYTIKTSSKMFEYDVPYTEGDAPAGKQVKIYHYSDKTTALRNN